MVPLDRLVKELNSVNSVPPLFNFWDFPNWVYAEIGEGCALILGIIIFIYKIFVKLVNGKVNCGRGGAS